MNFSKRAILFISFIEGFIVMSYELTGNRILAPIFGESLIVWLFVLSTCIVSLAMGYYFSTLLIEKFSKKINHALSVIFFICMLVVMTSHSMPTVTDIELSEASFYPKLFLASLVLYFPALFVLGMVPIILINVSSQQPVGKSSGTVFFISTVGGIIGAYLTGFLLLPEIGVTYTCFFIGGIALLVALSEATKSFRIGYSVVFILLMLFTGASEKQKRTGTGTEKIIYHAEGIQGQILVSDINTTTDIASTDRILYVNKIGQTWQNLTTKLSSWSYPTYIASIASCQKEKSNVLLIGLGAGTIANMLMNYLNFTVDAVEFDSRLPKIAYTYFDLNRKVNITIDDGRHYINVNKKKYDVVIIDVFHAENLPYYMFTKESFQQIRSALNENGMLLINFPGFVHGDEGVASRSLFKTLQQDKWKIKVIPTYEEEKSRNLLFVAKENDFTLDNPRIQLKLYDTIASLNTLGINMDKIVEENPPSFLLTDDKPIFERYAYLPGIKWRIDYNKQEVALKKNKGN